LDFYDFFWRLKEIGVGDVFIPFLLIFTLIYSILQATKVLGENSKRFNVIVAMSIALIVVIPHVTGDYPPGKDIVVILNQAIPGVVGVAIAVIMFFILVGAFGTKPNVANLGGIFVILSIIVVFAIFGNAAGWFGSGSSASLPSWLNFLNDPDVATFIVIILVFGIVLWLIVREPGQKKSTRNLGTSLANFFKWFNNEGGK